MTTTKIKIRVNFIGKIWMPVVTCASQLVLTDSDNAQFTEPWDLMNHTDCLEFVEHCLTTRTGDFQSITDFEAIREVTVTTDNQDNSNRTIHSHSHFITIKAWNSEENELTYVDCMYPTEQEA